MHNPPTQLIHNVLSQQRQCQHNIPLQRPTTTCQPTHWQQGHVYLKGGKCAPGHTTHSATQTCRVHTTYYNKQQTYTQHMHRTQMICTSYHHQRPSSTLSMGGRRRGKWTVDVNPVNSEQHMHYIHLVIKEQHCSGECLHRRLSQSSHARALCIGAATHSPPQVSITASVRRLFAISGYCLTCYISVYICY